jgi:hypothetical protein
MLTSILVFSHPYLRNVMTDYPSNSQRPRKAISAEPTPRPAERPEVKKVVEGEIVVRKKSLGKRFRDTFLAEDGMTIREYVTDELIIPAVRDLIYDITIGSVERALFRDGRPSRSRSIRPSLPGGAVRYDLAARNAVGRREDPRPPVSRRSRTSQDFSEEVVFDTRVDAEAVLTGMYDILEQYNEVKLSDFFELIGRSSNYVDERYGWTNLFGSRPVRTRHGWLLDLPRTEQLER